MSNSPNSWAGIARMGGLGDNLIASSVLPGLKKRYGHVEVISAAPWSAMFENNPNIDKLTVRDNGDPVWGDGHSWQAWFRDREKDYAFFANLSHSCEVQGVFVKVQTAYWWPKEMRRKLCSRSYLEIAHDICNIPYDEIAPDFFPTEEEIAGLADVKDKVGDKFIAWLMSGSRIDKVHPEADTAIATLLKETSLPVVIIGGPGKDYELAKLIETEVKKRNGSTDGLYLALSPSPETPTWNPRRVCALVQQAHIVVGPDTGPMWAVASHDMPKVLFASHAGPTNVTKHWKNTTTLAADPERVPCFPCHRLHDDQTTCVANADRTGAACISDIKLETIVTTVKEKLDGCDQRIYDESNAGLGTGRGNSDTSRHAGDRSIVRLANLN